jgi:signal transduction histidine kinase
MFSNLLENAIKYKSEGKIEIVIHERFLEIKNHIKKDIPKEQVEKLTKSFYQIDTSRNTE